MEVKNKTSEKYLQFPLSVLAMELPFDEILDHIFSTALVRYGEYRLATLEPSGAEAAILEEILKTYGELDATHANIPSYLGSKNFGVPIASFDKVKEQHARVVTHSLKFSGTTKVPLVRIRDDIYWRVRDRKALTEREFRVLCGIYSAIGDHKMRRLTREELQQRSLGYPSGKRDLQVEKWMTTHEIRKTRDKLHQLKFFVMLTYARRQTYYSHRLSKEELHSQILESKTRSAERRRMHRDDSAELTRQVKERIKELAHPQMERACDLPF
jgi:hypothetical protein